MPDAVVVGAGPNGLVAANLLADAGWSVTVLEEQPEPGGAVRHDGEVAPGFVNDLFSSFYPLAAASPVLGGLRLEEHGLRWAHAPHVLAHPLTDGTCAVLDRDVATTAASLDAFALGDGAAWERLHAVWDRYRADILDALFTPFPPVRATARLALRLRGAGGLRLARTLVLPVRRMGEEEFRGEGGRPPGRQCPARRPRARGGRQRRLRLADVDARTDLRLPRAGRRFRGPHRGPGPPAARPGRHAALRPARRTGPGPRPARRRRAHRRRGDGHRPPRRPRERLRAGPLRPARRPADLPDQVLTDLRRFQWDFATFKVDWALDGPVPWQCEAAARAGTVHLSDGLDELTRFAAQIAMRQVPDRPFSLFGQMTTTDPTRSPRGTESAWAYTHVPHDIRADAGEEGITGTWDTGERELMADRVERQVERFAPGFRALIRARRVLAPPTLQALDANLEGGAINGGTTAMHQQLVFRPVPGTGRPETPVAGLFLASAGAHPGAACTGRPAPTPRAPHCASTGSRASPGSSGP